MPLLSTYFQIAQRFNMDQNKVLDNVAIARAMTTDHQSALLVKAAAMMEEGKYALVIVDSAMAVGDTFTSHFQSLQIKEIQLTFVLHLFQLYRTDYTGRGELFDRQQHLNRFLRMLKKLTDMHGVAIVVTNQVVATMGNSSGPLHGGGNQNDAAGGYIFSHATATRLSLRAGRQNSRVCRIVKSPCRPEAEAQFWIRTNGIGDEQE